MAEFIMSYALERLGDFLIGEVKFFQGVGQELDHVNTQLQWMKAFLKDASAKQDKDERIRNWMAEIQILAYDIEDIVESLALEVESTKKAGAKFAIWNPVKTKYNLGSKLEDINVRISDLTKSLKAFGIRELPITEGSNSAIDRKPKRSSSLWKNYPHIPENPVGVDEDVNLLVKKLVGEERRGGVWRCCAGGFAETSQGDNLRKHRVVSICGMGGIGKTTLAKKVYSHAKVRQGFDHFVWINISQQWEKRSTWEQILFKLSPPSKEQREEIEKMRDDDVAEMVFKELQKKKCLVVLDDIWDVHAWKILSAGFPTEDTGSKIILTTRKKEVARHADPRCYIHEPRCLNEARSWELFQRIALPRPPDDQDARNGYGLEKLGKEMVKHCKGLPLAITVLGGLLSTKQTFDEWDKVHENIKSYLNRQDESFSIPEVLALSYDDLPQRLKPLFLYLGIFPEDFLISVKKLTNLWIAEGMIPPVSGYEGEETMEDVAYRYLDEMAERYMVQVEKRSPTGRIKTCRMHDLMRDLCLSRAQGEDICDVANLNDKNKHNDFFQSITTKMMKPTGRIRRLSVNLRNFSGHIGFENEHYPPIRSILGFSLQEHSGISQQLMESMVNKFKLLRILDLDNVKGFKIPDEIGKLVHLRLLNVASAWIGELPSSMGDLSCLLTLYLDRQYSTSRMPDVFWKMERLRHLYLPPDCGYETERLRFANLGNLQTLFNFPSRHADVKDLITLTNLRKLVIVIEDEASLGSFQEIFEPGTVTFNHLRSLIIKPKWISFNSTLDVEKVTACCPRLCKLKLHGKKVYERGTNAS
ncbi:CC-NBS-LRR class disease resistance protein [Theobroma cacao]|uniref:CC-NBS-LRR class disease resistance protein n=1 Tax=Theobroma cacao TaxID=3641 RepID=A0A061FQ67_THECC|nr:CC-NBS-LRR class disease resistance protein [Theobroma cacao]